MLDEAKKLISKLANSLGVSGELGSGKGHAGFWYNANGDCIEFQTADEAVIADRIDDYLTIFRSVDAPREAIGFKIKGVKSLTGMVGGEVAVAASGEGKKVISVKVLLLRAFGQENGTYKRITGYADAIEPLSEAINRLGNDQVALAG